MVFDTINYLNEENSKNENNYERDYKIDHLYRSEVSLFYYLLIEFYDQLNIFYETNNSVVRYFYNNKRDDSNKIMTQGYATNPENFEKLGFTNSVSNDYRFILLADSLMYYFKILDADINKRIKELLEVGKYSVYSYLKRYLFRRVSYEEDIDQTIGAMK